MITELKLCRMRRGMGQWGLARLVGGSESLLSRIESGKNLASQDMQDKLCKVFAELAHEYIVAGYTRNTTPNVEETSDDNQ